MQNGFLRSSSSSLSVFVLLMFALPVANAAGKCDAILTADCSTTKECIARNDDYAACLKGSKQKSDKSSYDEIVERHRKATLGDQRQSGSKTDGSASGSGSDDPCCPDDGTACAAHDDQCNLIH